MVRPPFPVAQAKKTQSPNQGSKVKARKNRKTGLSKVPLKGSTEGSDWNWQLRWGVMRNSNGLPVFMPILLESEQPSWVQFQTYSLHTCYIVIISSQVLVRVS